MTVKPSEALNPGGTNSKESIHILSYDRVFAVPASGTVKGTPYAASGEGRRRWPFPAFGRDWYSQAREIGSRGRRLANMPRKEESVPEHEVLGLCSDRTAQNLA